jgi:hypothetical protein
VDWLTSFWDELLVGHKDNLEEPDRWLGNSDQIHEYFIDWVAIGLCGYGQIWDYRMPLEAKRRVIKAYPQARYRQSLEGLSALVKAILPGSSLLVIIPARADFDYADLCNSSIPGNNSYQILVPVGTKRRSLLWVILERVLRVWAPIGISRVQHEVLLSDQAIEGDVITADGSYGYQD